MLFRFYIAWLLIISAPTMAYPTQDDESLGYDSMRNTKSKALWFRADATYFKGIIKTSPPDAEKMDQRLQSFIKLSHETPLMPNLTIRPSFKMSSSLRTIEDVEEPKTYQDDTTFRFMPGLTATYTTSQSMDVFVGGTMFIMPKHYEVTTSTMGKQRKTFNTGYLFTPHVGISKKTGGTGGGLFLSFKSQQKRKYEHKVFTGEVVTGKETLFEPMVLGLFGETQFGPQHELYGELLAIQAAGGGEKDAQGKTTGADHFLARLRMNFLVTASSYICPTLTYKTLGYADQTYMTMDNIPSTDVSVDYRMGTAAAHTLVGFNFARGADKQSLPEFNASYTYQSYSLRLGYRASF